MSYGIQAYAVDLDVLKKTAGSGDAVLAKRLATKLSRQLRSVDDIDFDEGLLPTAEVLRRLVVDGAPDDGDEEAPGYKWGYALEMLCRGLGEWMPPAAFSGMHSDYFDRLDAALKKAGAKRTVTSFFWRGSPLALPAIDDFPSIGWLAPKEIAEWRADLAPLLGDGAGAGGNAAASPARVALRYEKGSSKKFWRGEVSGSTFTVTFGRIGTKGQTKPKKLATPAAAAKELAKVAAEKRTKGYVDDVEDAAFVGRVEGKKLVVTAGGKKTVRTYPTNAAAQKALSVALARANASGADRAAGAFDADTTEAFRELLAWMDVAAKKKRGLVFFYY